MSTDFHALHVKGKPLVLFNIWDAGSARAVADAGAQALATGSAPVAMAQGFADGEKIPLEMALANIGRICAVSDLPVSMDLEGGYATEPEGAARTAALAVEAGAAGFNFEDQIVGGDGLHDLTLQVERVAAVKTAAPAAFLNARTDYFLKAKPEDHDTSLVAQAIARGQAYAEAGADGFFVPGLRNAEFIRTVCDEVAVPINVIALPGTPGKSELADLGVARISYGPVPYKKMIGWLEEQARAAFQ